MLETNQSDHSYFLRVQVRSKQGPRSRLLGRSSQSRIMSAASRIAVCLKSVDFEVFGKVQGKHPEIIMLVARGVASDHHVFFHSAGVFFRKVRQTCHATLQHHVEYDLLTHTHTHTLPVHSPEGTRLASGWVGKEHGEIDSGGCGAGRGETGGRHVSLL